MMHLQVEKRFSFSAVLAGICLLMTAAGMMVLLCVRSGAEQQRPPLAQRDGYALSAGAPALAGKTVAWDREALLQGTLLLVSPDHPLPKDYPAPSTRTIRAMVGAYLPAAEGVPLRQEVIYALCCMQFDHPLDGDVLFFRGAVSAAQQEELRREAFERFSRIYPLTEALRQAQAVPGGGESDHQTGLAVDLALTPPLALGEKDPLRRNAAGQWIDDHLWEYGFLREKEAACEAIHLRYVGAPHAAALHVLGMDLPAYWALLREERALTLWRKDAPYAYLYCFPCEGTAVLSVPDDADFCFSADNTGWAVAAVAAQQRF